jgi:thymidylate synthase ThyX
MMVQKKQASELTELQWQKINEIADVFQQKISDSGVVYLISPKTTIPSEEMAMIQSLYSRDPASILFHLLEVAEKGAKKFMEQFYVGYGHKSIGDCGHVLLAFEGVSMLAAKAIQDSQLYAGQEASTRYIDFSNQPFLVPNVDSEEYEKAIVIQEEWRLTYMKFLPFVQRYVFEKYPYKLFSNENSEKVWEKTIKARAFDILRGFLPAGATTCVAWWTSISHAGDHLSWLRCHPLQEVRDLAQGAETVLKEAYPSSFTRNVYEEREDYKKKWYDQSYYLDYDHSGLGPKLPQCELALQYNSHLLDEYKDFILERPKGVELPWQIGEAANVQWADVIDFGSFRDIQRHRAVIQRMGLLGPEFGFHEWYLENLPLEIRDEIESILESQLRAIEGLSLNKFDKQYLYPMGMKVPIRITGSLSKMFYLLELRAQKRYIRHCTKYRMFFLKK